jgi:hypothetical protein
MTAAKVRKLEEDIKNAQKKRETYLTLFSKYDKFDDIVLAVVCTSHSAKARTETTTGGSQ